MLSWLQELHSIGPIEFIFSNLEVFRNSDTRNMFEFSSEPIDGFPTDELKVDQAYLNITSHFDKPLWLYTLSSECVAVSTWDFLNKHDTHIYT